MFGKKAVELDTDAITERDPLSWTVSVDERGGRTCVALTGELDGASAPALQAQLANLTDEPGGDLVLELAGLTFVDSTGLALFVSLHKRLATLGHELVLKGASPVARRLFQITKLDELLNIEPT